MRSLVYGKVILQTTQTVTLESIKQQLKNKQQIDLRIGQSYLFLVEHNNILKTIPF